MWNDRIYVECTACYARQWCEREPGLLGWIVRAPCISCGASLSACDEVEPPEPWPPIAPPWKPPQTPEPCEWTEDEEGNWWTTCDNGTCFDDGGPTENHWLFCPYCGAAISAVAFAEPATEGEDDAG